MSPADTLFISTLCARAVVDDVLNTLAVKLGSIPGIGNASIMTPAGASTSDGLIRLVVEIDFENARAMMPIVAEEASRNDFLAAFDVLARLAAEAIVYQPMSRREMFRSHLEFSFAPVLYLVEYPGKAEDLEAWLEYFDRVHAPILARLPQVKRVTTFRPAENLGGLAPWRLDGAMQRNAIMFDDIAAFDTALSSPVLAEIRADATRFSAYSPLPTRTLMDARLIKGLVPR